MDKLDEFKEIIKRRERKKRTVFIISMTLALTLSLYLFLENPFSNSSQIRVIDNFKIPSHHKAHNKPEEEMRWIVEDENGLVDSLSENIDTPENSISGNEIELKLFPYQGNQAKENTLSSVEKMPRFMGGQNALEAFLKNHLEYPTKALENNIEGKVIIQFVVSDNGALTDFDVVHELGFGCDEEALRIAESMPAWIPGEEGGIPVPVIYTMPITFEIN